MNRLLLLAAVLALLTALVHIVVGSLEITRPLLASAFSDEMKWLLFACWHLVSVVLALSALALLWGARQRGNGALAPMVNFISLLWIGFAVVFVGVALSRPEPGWLLRLPQWMALLPVGLIGLLSSALQERR